MVTQLMALLERGVVNESGVEIYKPRGKITLSTLRPQSRRCRYRSINFACFYLNITVVIFIDYSDIDRMMDINNEKC